VKSIIVKLSYSLLISLLILTSGCGYKLRDIQQGLNGQIISLFFDPNEINLNFIEELKLKSGLKRIYLNQDNDKAYLSIKILEHSTSRYSAALGDGARSKEARLEYLLRISLTARPDQEELIMEIRDNSNYSFDESKILAIEEIEKRIKENFFANAINRLNFAVLNLGREDT
tara:strand:+ start:56 stop:571 length:516 start_codon:yes stop_codon:yes gene_type:complete